MRSYHARVSRQKWARGLKASGLNGSAINPKRQPPRSPPIRSPFPPPPAAHFTCRPLPSNRGFGGIPRSLSVLLLDGNAEVIPAELARGVRHRAPNQLISTRRHSAECRIPPRPVSPNDISRYVAVPQAVPQPPPCRCSHHPRLRPRRISPTARGKPARRNAVRRAAWRRVRVCRTDRMLRPQSTSCRGS